MSENDVSGTVNILVRLPRGVRDFLDASREGTGESRTSLIRRILHEWVEKRRQETAARHIAAD